MTPEQRKQTCRVDRKHRNNRLVTDGPTTETCDSDAPYISQVCAIKKKPQNDILEWYLSDTAARLN